MLGIIRVDDFLDPATCRALVSDMEMGRQKAATIVGPDNPPGTVDEEKRRSRLVKVSAPSASDVRERLADLRPVLESHFDAQLGEPDEPQFLTYGPGDFFLAHRDAVPSAPQTFVRRRRISVVVFVNGQSDGTGGDGYSGGSLVLYGLMGQASEKYGVPVEGKSGQLVAFRSDLLHEVTEVADGPRHTVVSWFPAPDDTTEEG